jgi:hypothetical protein
MKYLIVIDFKLAGFTSIARETLTTTKVTISLVRTNLIIYNWAGMCQI